MSLLLRDDAMKWAQNLSESAQQQLDPFLEEMREGFQKDKTLWQQMRRYNNFKQTTERVMTQVSEADIN